MQGYHSVHIGKQIPSGEETASHAGHCPINLVNVQYIETELYTKSRTRVIMSGN